MSNCYLPHKEAINNLKEDIKNSGFVNVPLGNRINASAFEEHNRRVKDEAEKINKVVNKWNSLLRQIGITEGVVTSIVRPYEGDVDSKVGVRYIIDIQYNEVPLTKLDDLRKSLGIYESKLSYGSYLKNKKLIEPGTEIKTEEVKPGVSELFESNPELASIGTPEQYSQYLDTIFPDSKVKDILLHGSSNENIEIVNATWKRGFYATAYKEMAKGAGGSSNWDKVSKIYRLIVNAKNPRIELKPAAIADMERNPISYIKEQGYDSFIINNQSFKNNRPNEEVVVFEPEQIHILGSKQDIEGFKRFVEKPVPAIEKEEEDLATFKEKIANFKESLKIKNVDTKASNQKIKNQLEQDKQTLLNNGFVKTGENTYSFKTNSYSTFIVKNKERLVQNADIEFQKKDGEYTITYKLKDSADKSRAELQKQGEIPFTQSDLKEALKDRTFVDDLADNIFEGLDEADKALLKKKLDDGDYNINCKL